MTDQTPPPDGPPNGPVEVPQPPVQPKPEYSPALRQLGQAISQHPQPPQVAFLGVKLYVEVLGSGRMEPKEFLMTGQAATGEEEEGALKVPFLAIAGRTVASFDPTLPPEAFRLA